MLKPIKLNSINSNDVIIDINLAKELGYVEGQRIEVRVNNLVIKKCIGFITYSNNDLDINNNQIGLSSEIYNQLDIRKKSLVFILPSKVPKSFEYVTFKITKGHSYNFNSLIEIIEDINNNNYTLEEIRDFKLSCIIKGLSRKESSYFVEALISLGKGIEIDNPKNKSKITLISTQKIIGDYSDIIASIIASNANVICPVIFSKSLDQFNFSYMPIERIIKILHETNTGFFNLRNSKILHGARFIDIDDRLFRDYEDVTLDAILAIAHSKIMMCDKLLLDIPVGKNFRCKSKSDAIKIYQIYNSLAIKFDLKVFYQITNFESPTLDALGLETIDGISNLLSNAYSTDQLIQKSQLLAGRLLEITKSVKQGLGLSLAISIIDSDKAILKFEKLVNMHKTINSSSKSFRASLEFNELDLVVPKLKLSEWNTLLGFPNDKNSGIRVDYDIKRKLSTVHISSSSKLRLDSVRNDIYSSL